jgi:hypothetical protein
MSSMLEQAIVDAKALKEAAIKNAESTIVEKYAGEVRQAVEKLLEQDPLEDEDELAMDDEMGMPDEMGMDDEMDMGAEEEDPNAAVMAAIPMGHDSGAEDVIEIDLDQIMAAAAEEGTGEEDQMDREEMADEVGIPELEDEEEMLDPGFEEFPAGNRTDEINSKDELEIDEEELLEMVKEILTIEVPEEAEEALKNMEEASEEHEEEEDYVDVHEISDDLVGLIDGQDPKELEEIKNKNIKLENKLAEMIKEKKQLIELLGRSKDRLEEVNLSNARLFYTNRVLEDTALNERQRKQLAEHIRQAHTVDEAKTIFETLQKTVSSRSVKNKTKSLSEVVTRRSSTILSSRREVASTNKDPEVSRWAKLAGILDK